MRLRLLYCTHAGKLSLYCSTLQKWKTSR
jgi:hypothetical protein